MNARRRNKGTCARTNAHPSAVKEMRNAPARKTYSMANISHKLMDSGNSVLTRAVEITQSATLQISQQSTLSRLPYNLRTVSKNAANVSWYALVVHTETALEMSRSAEMGGVAANSAEMLNESMYCARQNVTSSVILRAEESSLSCLRAGGGGGAVTLEDSDAGSGAMATHYCVRRACLDPGHEPCGGNALARMVPWP